MEVLITKVWIINIFYKIQNNINRDDDILDYGASDV